MTDIREFDWGTPDYRAFCELRQEILRVPLGLDLYDEDLDREKEHVHIGLYDGDRLAGGAILIRHDDAVGQLRQMLVIPELQSRGLGRRIVGAIEAAAYARSMRTLFLHARVVAVAFYRRCGFATVGDEFVSHGIPHVRMEKSLDILENARKNAAHKSKEPRPMNTNDYLEMMRFPKEWQELQMVPDDDYIKDQVFKLKPGMEHTPEHARHDAFHYWLAREPSTAQLGALTQLSIVDPDTEMGESIRAEILKLRNCDEKLRELIAHHSE